MINLPPDRVLWPGSAHFAIERVSLADRRHIRRLHRQMHEGRPQKAILHGAAIDAPQSLPCTQRGIIHCSKLEHPTQQQIEREAVFVILHQMGMDDNLNQRLDLWRAAGRRRPLHIPKVAGAPHTDGAVAPGLLRQPRQGVVAIVGFMHEGDKLALRVEAPAHILIEHVITMRGEGARIRLR